MGTGFLIKWIWHQVSILHRYFFVQNCFAQFFSVFLIHKMLVKWTWAKIFLYYLPPIKWWNGVSWWTDIDQNLLPDSFSIWVTLKEDVRDFTVAFQRCSNLNLPDTNLINNLSIQFWTYSSQKKNVSNVW